MQTHEWEALLDGTADGPWEAERHGREEVISICTTVHTPKRYVGDIYGEWNARLAAAAPEAVAEAVRLRKAIATMRDRHLARIAAADYITADLMEAQFTANDLTRILEGDNNE